MLIARDSKKLLALFQVPRWEGDSHHGESRACKNSLEGTCTMHTIARTRARWPAEKLQWQK